MEFQPQQEDLYAPLPPALPANHTVKVHMYMSWRACLGLGGSARAQLRDVTLLFWPLIHYTPSHVTGQQQQHNWPRFLSLPVYHSLQRHRKDWREILTPPCFLYPAYFPLPHMNVKPWSAAGEQCEFDPSDEVEDVQVV
jgi:hypothetical protein